MSDNLNHDHFSEESGSERLLIINGHDLVDPNDGMSKISNHSLLQVHKNLSSMLASVDPDNVVIVFDRNKSDNRKWKQRPSYENIDQLEDLLNHMGVKVSYNDSMDIESYMASFAKKGYDEGYDSYIYSHNKLPSVMMKLPNVSYIHDSTMRPLDKDQFQASFGLRPETIRSLFSMIGMPLRGITGAQRISQKNATEWLSKYSTISTVLKNANEVLRPRRAQALLKDTNLMKANYENLALKVEELNLSMDNFVRSLATPELAHVLHNFKPHKKSAGKVDLTWDAYLAKEESALVLDDYQRIQEFASDCAIKRSIYIEPLLEANDIVSGFAVSNGKGNRGYVPLSDLLTAKEALEALSGALNDKKIKIKCFNAKALNKLHMREIGTRLPIEQDFALTAYILGWTRDRTKVDDPLTFIAKDKLEGTFKSYREFMRSHFSTQRSENIPNEHLARYASARAEQAERLLKVGRFEIEQSQTLNNHFFGTEMPMASVLGKMENDGVYVDPKALKALEAEFLDKINELTERCYILAGDSFNVNSPGEVADIIYNKLKLPKIDGKMNTSEEVMSVLAKDHELPGHVLELRKLIKLQGTYTTGLLSHINPETGLIHSSFNQTIAKTGRLSSSDPGLQNIPSRSEDGRKIREAFVSREGYAIIAGDYSQVELRVMAHMANEISMIKAFKQGADIHRITASEVFNVPFEEVTGIQRRNAKAINFGLIYGMSEFGLAKELGISTDEAKKYQNMYFERYPSVKAYMDQQVDFARKHGYVETLTGRKILLPDINSSNYGKRSSAERLAINAPIQGTAADIIKRAMVKIDQALFNDSEVKMTMQVHDELVFEVPAERVEMLGKQIKTIMENAMTLKVPLDVDIAYGDNWEASHTLDSALKEKAQEMGCQAPKRMSGMTSEELKEYIQNQPRSELGMLI